MRDCSPCNGKPKATLEMPPEMGTTPPEPHGDLIEQPQPVPSWMVQLAAPSCAGSLDLGVGPGARPAAGTGLGQALGPDGGSCSSAGLPQAPAALQSHEPCTAQPPPSQPDVKHTWCFTPSSTDSMLHCISTTWNRGTEPISSCPTALPGHWRARLSPCLYLAGLHLSGLWSWGFH